MPRNLYDGNSCGNYHSVKRTKQKLCKPTGCRITLYNFDHLFNASMYSVTHKEKSIRFRSLCERFKMLFDET